LILTVLNSFLLQGRVETLGTGVIVGVATSAQVALDVVFLETAWSRSPFLLDN
jgi:hypothetical protein